MFLHSEYNDSSFKAWESSVSSFLKTIAAVSALIPLKNSISDECDGPENENWVETATIIHTVTIKKEL